MKKFLRCAIVAAVLAVLLVSQASAFNYWDNGYILAPDGKTRMAMPKPYTCEQVITGFEGSEVSNKLNNPQDLFLSDSGDYYIADTGNKRIVRLTNNFEYVAEYTGGNRLSAPEGVFVTNEGDMYIADSAAQKIVHLDPLGEWVEDFVMPESELLYNVTYFSPSKVALNPVNNYLYVVQGKQFMSIDAANNFKGYIGANKVGFNLINFIVMTFATDAQKDQMNTVEPDAYYNFCVANGGKIYATSAEDNTRISVINTVGTNTYPKRSYGEVIYNDAGKQKEPAFKDICVDENEIITVIEENTRCLYQYDQDGNLLCIFGGEGSTAGYFNIPSSIVYAGNGRLVTLDAADAKIQIFEPTEFISTVQKAVVAYADGKYDQSLELWEQIKKDNASYNLAREFIGKINMKKGLYSEVLDDFKQSEDRENYGKAFEKLRYEFMQQWFYPIIGAIIVAIILLVIAMKQVNKYVRKIKKEFWDELEG
ncbi:MAG: NHL repeat-containing protein [Clostridia bacterium]|nr:NHL repeat-containing protein [Clostridia bacterium]